jgi:type I restriction enzyme R subunit
VWTPSRWTAWFDRITEELDPRAEGGPEAEVHDSTDQLNKAQQKVMRIAWDVGEHYRDNWQSTPYKAQLVAQDKATALLYKRFLDDFGLVSGEVLISGPDEREGEDDVHEESADDVKAFWKKMMAKYGSDKEYNRQIISALQARRPARNHHRRRQAADGLRCPMQHGAVPDAPKLKGHTLLQAIARVNRLYDGKDFGYIIDYRGVLQNLG